MQDVQHGDLVAVHGEMEVEWNGTPVEGTVDASNDRRLAVTLDNIGDIQGDIELVDTSMIPFPYFVHASIRVSFVRDNRIGREGGEDSIRVVVVCCLNERRDGLK